VKKWFLFTGCFFLFLVFWRGENVYAADSLMDDIDYEAIQRALDEATKGEETLDFGGYVKKLISGEESFSLSSIGKILKGALARELKGNLNSLVKLLTIAVLAAVFTNFSHTFQNSQVAETGFYITYLLMFTILAASFMAAMSMASNTIGSVISFMKALVPAYCVSIGFCIGSGTSVLFYEAVLILITTVDIVLIKVILPLIGIYMMAVLGNHLTHEDLLSKLSELLATIIKWGLRTLLAVVVGFGTVQALITPAVDQVKRSALMKMSSAIPGIGSILSGVTETVLGAGVLLKNAIGVAGVIAIVVICLVPILKLAIYVILYKLGAAAIQPISDSRLVACMSAASEAASMLMQTVFVAAVLFEIAITIVAVATIRM